MKKIGLWLSFVLAVTALIVVKRMKKQHDAATYTIGILQTASHPALDAARQGFVEQLEARLGDKVACVVQNAQGSVATAHAFAQQFAANDTFTAFYAIATPAAQALGSVEKQRPIVIAAVTDPDALGLMRPMGNVCGVNDMIDVQSLVAMLKALVGQTKTVGLIFTAGQTNSLVLVKAMHEALHAQGLIAVDFAISSEAELPMVIELACRKTDVLLAPTDHTVAGAIALIAALAKKYKKPLIVSDNMLVEFGALAARGVDYKESGKIAADEAYELLMSNKKPYDMPIQQVKSSHIFVNQTTLQELELVVPEELQSQVTMVNDK